MNCLINEINVLFLEWEAADLPNISEHKTAMFSNLDSLGEMVSREKERRHHSSLNYTLKLFIEGF